MEKALSFIHFEEELKVFKDFLPDSEYKEILKEFKHPIRVKINKSVKKSVERMKCLKKWLSKIEK